jgi:hypothetical protein
VETKIEIKEEINLEDKLIPLSQAAQESGYTPEHLNLLCRQGKIRARKIRRNWFTTNEWLEEYKKLNSHPNVLEQKERIASVPGFFPQQFVASGLILLIIAASLLSYLAYQGIFLPKTFPLAEIPNKINFENDRKQSDSQVLGEESEKNNSFFPSINPENPLNFIEFKTITRGESPVKSVKYWSGDIVIKNNNLLRVRKEAIDADKIELRSIEQKNISTGAINTRIIENGTIQGEDINSNTTLTISSINLTGGLVTEGDVTVNGIQTFEREAIFEDGIEITSGGADISGNLDVTGYLNLGNSSPDHFTLGAGDLFASGNLEINGDGYIDQNLNVGSDLHVNGVIYGSISGAYSPSGDLDMASNIIYNIGNSGTDFNTLGGLTLANQLSINSGGAIIQGNVGIGTTSPTSRLSVKAINDSSWLMDIISSTGYTRGGFYLSSGDSQLILYTNNGDQNIKLNSNGSSYFTGGNVGIGTTNPSALLSIAGDSTKNAYFFYDNSNVGDTTNGQSLYVYRRAAEADDAVKVFVDQWGIGHVNGSHDLAIDSNLGKVRLVSAVGSYVAIGNEWAISGQVFQMRQFGYISGAASNKYIQWQVNDTTDNFELSRQDSNIGYFDVQMPTIFTGGNIGIGTTNPSSNLHIASTGDARLYLQADTDNVNEEDNPYIDFAQDGGSGVSFRIGMNGSTGASFIGALSNAPYIMENNGSGLQFATYDGVGANYARMIITGGANGGYVGIGTTSPGYKLDVSSSDTAVARLVSSNSSAGIILRSSQTGGSDWYLFSTSNTAGIGGGKFGIYDGSSGTPWRMVIDSSGNVGIGTTNPGQLLHLYGAGSPSLKVESSNNGGPQLILTNPGSGQYSISMPANANTFRIVDDNNGTRLTINSSGYVGIGTTSPETLLSVQGDFNSKGGYGATIRGMNAHGSYLSIIQDDYYSWGIGIAPGLKRLDFVSNGHAPGSGSPVMSITDTGYVGIGTTNPGEKLDVNGNVFLSNNGYFGNSGGMQFGNLWNASTDYGIYSAVLNFKLMTHDGSAVQTRMFVNASNGNVGIGTTNPSEVLHVVGGNVHGILVESTSIAPIIDLKSDTNSITWRISNSFNSGSSFEILNSNNYGLSRFLINSSGNVGIGTTNPQESLHVVGNIGINTNNKIYLKRESSTMTYIDTNGWTSNDASIKLWDTASNAIIQMATNNLERVRIDSSGNVGIGTTAPSVPLQVVSTSGGSTTTPLVLQNSSTSSGTTVKFELAATTAINGSGNGYVDFFNRRQSDSSNDLDIQLSPGGGVAQSTVMYLDGSNDNVGIGTTNPNERLDVNGTNPRIYLADATAPGTTTNRLYSVSGNLTWNGINLTGGGSLPGATEGYTLRGNGSAWQATNNLFVKSDGSVGIGTTNPSALLSVAGDSTKNAYFFYDNADVGDTTDGQSLYVYRRAAEYDTAIRLYLNQAGIGKISSYNLDIDTDASGRLVLNPSGGNVSVGYLDPGTAKLAINGNVGIGTTNPGAKLEIASDAAIQLIVNGLTYDPLISFAWSGGNENLFFDKYSSGYGDGSTMRFTDDFAVEGNLYTTGNLGIGTTNPGNFIDILGGNGGLKITSTSDTNFKSALLNQYNTEDSTVITGRYDYKIISYGSSAGNTRLKFYTENTERMRISNVGYVGIGTTAPGNTLSVSGGVGIGTTAPGSLYLSSKAPDGGMIIEGNVGIGTTNPASKLTVSDSTADTNSSALSIYNTINGGTRTQLRLINAATGNSTTAKLVFSLTSSNPETSTSADILAIRTNAVDGGDTDLVFRTNNAFTTTEVLRLSAKGNVGIGTTNPGSYKLNVNGDVYLSKNNPTLYWGNQSGATNQYITENYGIKLNGGNTTPIQVSNTSLLVGYAANGENWGSGNLLVSGNVGIGTTNPQSNLHVNASAGISVAEEISRYTVSDDALSYLKIENKYANDNNFSPQIRGLYNGSALESLSITADGNVGADSGNVPMMRFNAQVNGAVLSTRPLFQFRNYNTAVMTISASGNLGIGTTNPGARLTVMGEGTGKVLMGSSGWGGNYVGISLNGTLDQTNYNFLSSSGNSNLWINRPLGADIIFAENHVTAMTLKSGGNLGIGTTNPGAKLHVSGGSILLDNNQPLQFKGNGGSILNTLVIDSSNNLKLANVTGDGVLILGTNGGAERMRIDLSGNVGIGTTNPGYLLDVQNGSINISAGWSYNVGGISVLSNSSSVSQLRAGSGGSVKLTVNGTNDALYINSSGNVGIGTTSPTTSLQIGAGTLKGIAIGADYPSWMGDSGVYANGLVRANNGMQIGCDNCSLAWGDLSTSIQGNSASDFIGFNTNNTEKLRIISNGNVGIGTTAPGNLLEISGPNAGNGLTISRTGGTQAFLSFDVSGTSVSGGFPGNIVSRRDLTLGAGNSEKVRITDTGNVGIGTTAPSYPIQIVSTNNPQVGLLNGSAYLTVSSYDANNRGNITTNASAGFGLYSAGSGAPMMFFTGGVAAGNERIRIDGTGNVGIGTTNPGALLDVYKTGTNDPIAQFGSSVANNGQGVDVHNGSGKITLFVAGANGQYIPGTLQGDSGIRFSAGNNFVIGNNTINAILVNNGGNVGIGTTNPGMKLDVVGAIRTDSQIYSSQVYPGYVSDLSAVPFGSASDFNTGLYFPSADNLGLVTGGSERIRINSSGNVGIGTTNPTSKLEINGASLLINNAYAELKLADQYSRIARNGNTLVFVGSPKDIIMDLDSDNNGTDANFKIIKNSEWADGTEVPLFLIQESGNVGIGTTNPVALFNISSTAATDLFRVDDNGSGDTSPLIITKDGYLGIGVTATAQSLEIASYGPVTTGTQNIAWFGRQSYSGSEAAIVLGYYANGSAASYGVIRGGGSTAGLALGGDSTNFASMFLNTSGNVGIGTTNPTTRILIKSAGSNTTVLAIGSNGATPGNIFQLKEGSSNEGILDMLNGSNQNAIRLNTQGISYLNGGNVGIGTTNPTVNLEVVGSILATSYFRSNSGLVNQNNNNNSRIQSLSAGAVIDRNIADTSPSLIVNQINASSTGDILDLQAGGVTKVAFLQNGNVGIGTTNPGQKLSVNGVIEALRTDNASENIQIYSNYIDSSNYGGNISWRRDSSGSTYNPLKFFAVNNSGSVERMRIDTSGNVGIGTTNPGYKLEVSGSDGIKLTGSGFIYASGTDMQLFADSGNNFRIRESMGGDLMIIKGTGNVGIGTTAPNYPLEVSGTVRLYNAWADDGTIGTPAFTFSSDSDNGMYRATTNQIGLVTAGTERIRIGNTGNVGIGTTNPQRALHVNGNIRMGALITGAGGAVAVYRDTNGDLADSTSSIQFKQDITGMEEVLPKIMDLQAVRFKWNESTSTPNMSDFGMIAEEVNQVLPDLVTYNPDGTPRGLKYEKMGLFALKGLQEQQTMINEQGTMISHQSSVISQLGNIANLSQEDLEKLNLNSTSIDDKLQIITDSLTNEDKILSQAQNDITDLNTKYQSLDTNYQLLTTNYQLLEDQMALIKEEHKALTDFYTAFDIGSVIMKDAEGNINLGEGKVAAAEIEALGMVKAKDIQAEENLQGSNLKLGESTRGQAVIKAGEKEVTIETPNASRDFQIYLTSINRYEKIYYNENDIVEGVSIKVKIDEATDQDIRFNWLIVK